MKKDFRAYIKEMVSKSLPVFLDGGMGTLIQEFAPNDYDIPEDVTVEHPQIIKKIHSLYLEAGANILTANTFGVLPLKLNSARYTTEQYINAAAKVMQEAVKEAEQSGNTNPHYLAWDTSQIGKLLEPMGSLTFDEAYENYKQAAILAEKAGFDVALIETMADLYEVKAAVLAIKESTNLPIIATMTFQENLRTLTGADVRTCVTYLESLHVDILGFNCGGSLKEGEQLAEQFLRYSHTPVLIQPNAGIPIVQKGKTVFLVKPEEFAQSQNKNRQKGAALLGGCCGTTPAHIKSLVELIKIEQGFSSPALKEEDSTCVCSYNQTVQIGGNAGPVIVGERINPTGKKKVKEALLACDMNFVLAEAESQINCGSQILDVNVGLPGIDESEMMIKAIKKLQSAFSTPLQIDSSEPQVIEKALRYYNGKALINSVNGKQEVMDSIFPLVKHYGGAIVCLCIDENGISPTAEGRAAVARKIIKEAHKYGIPTRDIVIDTLTLTVSSQQKEALQTCKAISILKDEFGSQGLKFILGVSNISFGLPRRDIINSRFFAMALYSGLDACIINPLSQPMTETFYGYRALANYDENCLDYIARYNGTNAPLYGVSADDIKKTGGEIPQNKVQTLSPKSEYTSLPENLSKDEKNLIDVIYKGFKDQSAPITKKMLEDKTEPVSIIDRCIVPALDMVGKDFEKGTKFLPQLLLSAETVSCAFEVIKNFLKESGNEQKSKGTIAIATVYGDIHDIGKNIVKAMLENYGFAVIDLGKNVPAEKILETVLQNDIKLVGLSALMTTTVTNMEKTIIFLRSSLKEKGKSVKIFVGGAVLTEDYAAQIGADYYSKDAMQSVAIAKEVFNG
ncbi:homocysteine S-methyltransferase family protein [Treponema pectinovorum]|uniref:homocysteine S-methyltransferase family protein n=1 Tax=Treponema pectinovorum TaxID=164 RepID=UPI0011C89ADE|nr:homocysteine S-methyltransferase family protein [Treponema pectinovorum]